MKRKGNQTQWPFTFCPDLDLGPRDMGVEHDTSSWCDEQLYVVTRKSDEPFRSYEAEGKSDPVTFDL